MKSQLFRLPLFGVLILTLFSLALGATQYQTATALAQGRGGVTVGRDYKHDVSPPLRDIKPVVMPPRHEHEANINPHVNTGHTDQPDPVVQSSLSAVAMPSPILNFNGIPFPGVACNCAPPDTNGEVGLTQYVQIVNEGYQVFNKSTGASVLGPVGITTIWGGFGGVCQNAGDGDPVVLYDQIANRWVVTQFAGSSVPTDECIAVSTTSDATGSYNRYGFHLGTNFFDYPHLGVWPDAYYMAMDVYDPTGTIRLGPQPFAFDRTAMLAGASATFITTGITGGSGEDLYLPSDLDGGTLPPSGAPNSFVEWPGSGTYKVYHFHVDFGTPSNSTFSLFANPSAAGFTVLCPTTRACVPEPNGSSLDAIGDRFMFRLAYRNFGDHEAVVTNYTVSSGGVAGIRWIELRNVTGGPVTVFQQSTYQPDTTWRWMGSAAMDGSGNLALGFSVSSSSVVPGLRYAGRLATDPLNTLAQGEAVLFAGQGSQTGTGNRWGDYSDLTVDPVDNCTFWYTNEYYPTGSSQFNWRTRIGNFKFATCGGSATVPGAPTLSASAGNAVVHLSWTAPSDGGSPITNYKVYRATSSGAETLLTTLGNVTSYDDTTVTNGTTYYYKVSAVNGVGEGAQSNEASATPQAGASVPSAPQNLTATAAKGKGIQLSWSAPASNGGSPITGYNIYRGTVAGGETLLTSVGNVTSFKDASTTRGQTYYYIVKAVNAVGEGPASNEAHAVAK